MIDIWLMYFISPIIIGIISHLYSSEKNKNNIICYCIENKYIDIEDAKIMSKLLISLKLLKLKPKIKIYKGYYLKDTYPQIITKIGKINFFKIKGIEITDCKQEISRKLLRDLVEQNK